MKICVLQPDYSSSTVDYRHYDPTRDLSSILPGHTVHHVALNKLTTYAQLKHLAKEHYDIFVNLCEGYLEWDIPSIDVIHSLDRLDLPYTGPNATLFDPSKILMKYVAFTANVRTPAHLVAEGKGALDLNAAGLAFPLFVKPAHAGDSLGVDSASLVRTPEELNARVDAVIAEFGAALVEQYIDGREFTVLVAGGIEPGEPARALMPIEFVFPEGSSFKTYAFKTSELHTNANIPVTDETLATRLRSAALAVFKAFGGTGYARMDFRMDATGELYFLEVNFSCSVFYVDGYEGSADHVLKHDPIGASGFAEHIIAEGIARHRRQSRAYKLCGNAVSGYGIVATRAIAPGEVVFHGEERPHRIATARHVADNWSVADQEVFRCYAYPLSDEVFALWDSDPEAWAPQNHSCDPNTGYDGLNVIALRQIALGEELTLDYTTFVSVTSAPFRCSCGSPNCRGMVTGAAGASVTTRESVRRTRP